MTDPRVAAAELYDQQMGSAAGWTGRLVQMDAADRDAGIYRVSLDAAVEAAAASRYGLNLADPEHRQSWKLISQAVREVARGAVRNLVTAAVTGGAQ